MNYKYATKKEMQEQLDNLYKEELNKEKLKDIFTNEKGEIEKLSAPFLIDVPQKYLEAKKRILFVGKETNKWWGTLDKFVNKDNSINILKDRYTTEILGGTFIKNNGEETKRIAESGWNNRFFIEYKKVRDELFGKEKGSIIWSNLLKMDNADPTTYSKNSINIKTVSKLSKRIFLKELEILQPDVIIFATGASYDRLIKDYFENKITNSKIIEPRALWKFEVDSIKCFRARHPQAMNRKSYKIPTSKIYDEIIDLIKEN